MTLDKFLSDYGKPAKDFAALVGVSAVQISRLRHGKTRPSWETAKRISKLTNNQVTVTSLMECETEEKSA
ncbi:helix-turn-helix domain-containing protein [Roseibium album]|uniref:helix-turn-helix domain-containing protein n=1 Tax=Roseibium album TaxID=311410 RepID=UPI0018CBA102|nr:helix-turn-helix transcriptional regulator [Roseibium album]MBG6211754.1 transcriptional regulator with XRE-family HTH domain [Labrenzia sp. EL_126]